MHCVVAADAALSFAGQDIPETRGHDFAIAVFSSWLLARLQQDLRLVSLQIVGCDEPLAKHLSVAGPLVRIDRSGYRGR